MKTSYFVIDSQLQNRAPDTTAAHVDHQETGKGFSKMKSSTVYL